MVGDEVGAGASAFGNAFNEFGDDIFQYNKSKQADKLTNLEISDITDKKEQTKLDNAYVSLYNPKTGIAKGERDRVSPSVLQQVDAKAEAKLQGAEDWVQKEDNADYLRSAYNSESLKDFKESYEVDETNQVTPETILRAEKFFNDKNSKASEIRGAKKELEWQEKLNKAKGKGKSGGYDGSTWDDIEKQVRTSMGLDLKSDFNSWDKKIGEEYNSVMGEVAGIARKYNLNDASLAYDLYKNKDNYVFDKNSVRPKTTAELSKEKDPLGLMG